MFITAILHWLFVPETFGPEKRESLRLQHEEESANSLESKSFSAAIIAKVKAPFYLLGKLTPHKDTVTGKRNYRLFILAISFLASSWVLTYGPGMIVYSAAKFHFGAKEVRIYVHLCYYHR
jgi:hypothetical protein